MEKIETAEFSNVFELIGKDWMLISAKAHDKVNTMTASWGGAGVLWGSDVVYVFIRESRYTKELVDESDTFSLTFLDTEKYRSALAYLGKVSGREEDKIANAGLHVAEIDGVPAFEEARITVICKKMAAVKIDDSTFTDPEIVEKWYKDGNLHTMYVGRIEGIYR